MRKILTAILAGTLCTGYAQSIRGIVKDAETGRPIAGALVTCKEESLQTDIDGTFLLACNEGKVVVDYMGYRPDTITLTGNDKQLNCNLYRSYQEITEVIIAHNKLDANTLLEKVKENIAVNYISPAIPLRYLCTAGIWNGEQEVMHGTMPVYWIGYTANEYINYQPVKRKGDKFRIDSDSNIITAINDYASQWKTVGTGSPLAVAKVDPKEMTTYLSSFEQQGETYYDLIVLYRKPAKIKYGVLKLMGRAKNRPTHAMSINHYQVRKKDFALVLLQHISIGAKDKQVEQFKKISNRTEYATWVRQARHHVTGTYEFAPNNEGKYLMTRWAIGDNLLNLNYTGKSFADGTWQYEYVFVSEENPLGETENFDIREELKNAASINHSDGQ